MLPAPRTGRRRGIRSVRQALGHRRHRRRHGHTVPHQQGRADGRGAYRAHAGEVGATAAGEIPRLDRPGNAVAPALSRSDDERRHAHPVRNSQRDHSGDPYVFRGARLSRSGDADDASDRRRRCGPPVRDPSQRARYGAVSADRAGAVSEAARRRRFRARVRGEPEFPQRRVCRRGTTPNSRCSSSIRPTATTAI